MKYEIGTAQDWSELWTIAPFFKNEEGKYFAHLTNLIRQISENSDEITMCSITHFFARGGIIAVATKKLRVVGFATLVTTTKINAVTCRIEHVVVDKKNRGQGLSRKMMEVLHEAAKARGIKKIHLSSNPARVEANALYQKLGYEQYETNSYRIELKTP